MIKPKYKEVKKYFIDLFNSRNAEKPGHPVMDGKIKDVSTGEIKYVKLWRRVSPSGTEYLSGYVFGLEAEEEPVIPEDNNLFEDEDPPF